ncbi:hypothetical protein GCM10011326_44750 [Salipiger profundus]|nr:hypothetical protein GCM10011326_44750 [Salipiger profundus]
MITFGHMRNNETRNDKEEVNAECADLNLETLLTHGVGKHNEEGR